MLLACSHNKFLKYDSTKPGTIFRRHTWRDVLSFTSYENTTRTYIYKLSWRTGNEIRNGDAKRKPTSQAWTGVGKSSSDPSRKNAQIRDKTDIDIMFSGHTHGLQMGIEIGNLRWSPAKYIYPQWADLYKEKEQYLYVNRGFGYLAFPGRVGITPELTIIELKRG